MTDLESGRWRLSRTSYEYYSGELSKLTGIKAAPPVWEEAVYSIAQFARNEHIASGERVLQAASSTPVLVIWRTRGETTAAIVFTPADIGTWLARVPGFDFGLETLDHQTILPVPKEKPHADRVLSFANAHWRLIASAAQPQSEARRRQPLLLTGLSLVIVLVLAGSYAVVKAVSRELAVARLQADFVSAVSHEFRSPLTTLRSMSEMLERGRVPSEERKQRYYSMISRETQRLHRLVEDLLDFGRMEAGKKQYDMRPTGISTLVSQVVAELSEEHATRGFEIVIRGMAPGVRARRRRCIKARRAEPARKRGQILRRFAPGRRRGQELGRTRIRERPGLRHRHIPRGPEKNFPGNSSAGRPRKPPASRARASVSQWCTESCAPMAVPCESKAKKTAEALSPC